MPQKNIPLSVCHKFLKDAYPRVSKDAAEQLQITLEEKAKEIVTSAKKFAVHAKRKTIMDADIRLALREVQL